MYLDGIFEMIDIIKNLFKTKKQKEAEEVAKQILLHKREYQEFWERCILYKIQLEKQMLNIQTFESNESIFTTLKLVDEAQAYMKIDISQAEQVIDNLEENKANNEEFNALVQPNNTENVSLLCRIKIYSRSWMS